MSDTVVMFDPQGVARDIPYEQTQEAIKAGGKPGVRVSAPDGSVRVVPADMMNEAAQHGGKVLPLEQQEIRHPGFWASLASDLPGIAKGIGQGLLGAPYQAYQGIQKSIDEWKSVSATGKTTEQAASAQRKAEGRSLPYRVGANVNESLGVNVAGEEQAAREGDVGGVAGHGAAGAAVAAAPLVVEGAARVGAKVAPPVIRTAAKVTNAALAKAPKTVGTAVGAGIGGAIAGHVGAEVGGAAGYALGGELSNLRVPGERFGLPKTAVEAKAASATAESAAPAPAAQPEPQSAALGRVKAKIVKQSQALGPNASVMQQAQALRDGLRDGSAEVIDQAISPTENRAANLRVKAQVDFYLKKGNVESAEAALDKERTAAPKAVDTDEPLPTEVMAILNKRVWQTVGTEIPEHLWNGMTPRTLTDGLEKLGLSQEVMKEANGALYDLGYRQIGNIRITENGAKFPIEGERIVPIEFKNRDIRDPKAVAARRADLEEDLGIQQSMRDQLQRSGWAAETEARKEFIARNAVDVPKSELVRAGGGKVAERPVKYTKTKGVKTSPAAQDEDLTGILKESLEEAKKKRK